MTTNPTGKWKPERVLRAKAYCCLIRKSSKIIQYIQKYRPEGYRVFRPWNLSTGPLPYSSSLTTTAMRTCMVYICLYVYGTVWLATHSDIHGFIVILITTLEQSYHCPCFRVGVTEPPKRIHWFPPGSIRSRSCVRDLNLGLLTPSFIFVTTHSIELQIPNFPLQPHGGIAAVWGEGDNVHFTWGHIREWTRESVQTSQVVINPEFKLPDLRKYVLKVGSQPN